MGRQVLWFSNDENMKENSHLEYFSIAEDVKMEKRPVKQRYRLMIQDFKRYINSKKSTLKPEDLNILDQMLIMKFNNLINIVEDDIGKGIYLSVALGIYNTDLKKSADNFSREYRKLLQARERVGYIPKLNQEKVDDVYKILIAQLRKDVFGNVLQLFSRDPNDPPQHEKATEEQAKILEEGEVSLAQLYNNIVGLFRSSNINAKVELNDKDIRISLL